MLQDFIRCLKLLHVEVHRFFECHALDTLVLIALHQLVDLDTLKRSILFDVLFQLGVSTAHSDHDLVGSDQQVASLRTDLVLALLFLGVQLYLMNG